MFQNIQGAKLLIILIFSGLKSKGCLILILFNILFADFYYYLTDYHYFKSIPNYAVIHVYFTFFYLNDSKVYTNDR